MSTIYDWSKMTQKENPGDYNTHWPEMVVFIPTIQPLA
jgi:hypothetical protein